MGLGQVEIRRRVLAAAALHGWSLTDLGPKLEAYGIPKHHAARIGRPKGNLLPSRALVLALAEILEVPTEWFVVEDWRPLISGGRSGDELERKLDLVLNHLGIDPDLAEAAEDLDRAASDSASRRPS